MESGSGSAPFVPPYYVKFDDSPEVIKFKTLIENRGPHDVLFKMGRQPLSDSEARLCESKDDDTIISMKKPGHGGKNVQQLAKHLAVFYLEDKDPGTRLEVGTREGEVVVDLDEKMRMLEEDKAFWRETYDIWRDFKYCRSKIIYAADLLESLQMRLTYFLHNSQEVSSVNITLPPFEFGIKQVSYTILVWHYFHKENEQSWSLNEKEWINFCMNYSEVNYVMDLKSKGLRKRHQKWQRRSAKKCKFTSSISRARGMRQLMCFQP